MESIEYSRESCETSSSNDSSSKDSGLSRVVESTREALYDALTRD